MGPSGYKLIFNSEARFRHCAPFFTNLRHIVVLSALSLFALQCDLYDKISIPLKTYDEYSVEEMSDHFIVSYSLDNDTYFIDDENLLFRIDENEAYEFITEVPSNSKPRLLFVSSSHDIFVSFYNGKDKSMKKYSSSSKCWTEVLGVECWRMTEDDDGNLYVGNYDRDKHPPARLYKSEDGGDTWRIVYQNEDADHFHTVRFDDISGRLWAAFGDGTSRNQLVSSDNGESFELFPIGDVQGHTDVAFSDDYIFWGSDDGSGRVFRHIRDETTYQTVLSGDQYIWFMAASGRQVYVGTMPKKSGQQGALLASSDQGETWEKVFEVEEMSTGAYGSGLTGESRALTASGWLYFSANGVSYRIRYGAGH